MCVCVCVEVEVGGVCERERKRERERGETFFCEWSSSSFFWRARALAGSELGEAKISLVPIFFFFSFLLPLEAESELTC